MKRFLLVLSSPSGGGKTTIARALLEARGGVVGYSVSATTRPMRRDEEEGRDYHFMSREEFIRRRDGGDFLEWAEYGGHLYGTLEEEVDRIVRSGRHALLDIEIQGARQIRQRRLDVVSIFILPPSAEVLLERLGTRDTGAPEDLHRRLTRAVDELREATAYDYLVVNDDRDAAVAAVAAVLEAESHRPRRVGDLEQRLARMSTELQEAAATLTAE